MNDLPSARTTMEEKQKLKHGLIEQLRVHNEQIAKIRDAIQTIEPPQRDDGKDSPRRIAKSIEALDFQISTSAFTPAQEKELLRRMQILKKQLAETTQKQTVNTKLDEQYALLRAQLDARTALRKQISTIGDELEQLYQVIIKEGAEHAKARTQMREKRQEYDSRRKERTERTRHREEERKELEPYMKTYDSFVSLEEIAEIRKKPQKEEAEA
ncbi:MAG: hypothetical protein V1728_02350 [Candidatus Micrarchaeota archaeon]